MWLALCVLVGTPDWPTGIRILNVVATRYDLHAGTALVISYHAKIKHVNDIVVTLFIYTRPKCEYLTNLGKKIATKKEMEMTSLGVEPRISWYQLCIVVKRLAIGPRGHFLIARILYWISPHGNHGLVYCHPPLYSSSSSFGVSPNAHTNLCAKSIPTPHLWPEDACSWTGCFGEFASLIYDREISEVSFLVGEMEVHRDEIGIELINRRGV